MLWVFLPVLGAFVAHAPVLRWNLLPTLARPLDGGAVLRGRRVLGDNKTWRGALAMWIGVVAATLLLSGWSAWWLHLPTELQAAGPLAYGSLLGLGLVLGELPNSFLKRQLDIAPGGRRRSPVGMALVLWDQADFVPAIWLTLLPLWTMSVAQLLLAAVVVTLVHLVLNWIGWMIGARTVPI